MQRFWQVFQVPQFEDDDLTRLARIFYGIVYTLTIPLPFYWIIILVADDPMDVKITNFLSSIVFLALMVGLLVLTRRAGTSVWQ